MGVEITGVWLRHEGRDPGIAVVLIAVGGKWVEVIRELDSGPYSVVVPVAEMLNARDGARAGQGEG
jgi:hypothetical protein